MDIDKIITDIENLKNLIYLINKRDKGAIDELNRIYKLLFNTTVAAGCGNCHIKAYHKLVNITKQELIDMSNQNYKIKPGILIEWPQGEFYSSVRGISDDVAKAYLNAFPQLISNFESYPAQAVKEKKEKSPKKVEETKKVENVEEVVEVVEEKSTENVEEINSED